MLHTQPWTGAEIYRLFAELTQNHVAHKFKDNNEVWTSIKRDQKIVFQGRINASDLEDNMYKFRGITMQLKLYCSCWGCKYRIQILWNENSLSDHISYIVHRQLSKAAELIVSMFTKSIL